MLLCLLIISCTSSIFGGIFLCFFSFVQVGVLVMLRCLLSRAMLLLPLSSLCIPTFRVVASSSSRCCLLTLRDFARSCSLAAFSAPLLCLHSRSLAALSDLCDQLFLESWKPRPLLAPLLFASAFLHTFCLPRQAPGYVPLHLLVLSFLLTAVHDFCAQSVW